MKYALWTTQSQYEFDVMSANSYGSVRRLKIFGSRSHGRARLAQAGHELQVVDDAEHQHADPERHERDAEIPRGVRAGLWS
jgi:hypothetical protein